MSKGVSPIPFVIVGFSLFSVYAFYSANMPLDASKWDFFWPLLIRAFGISMSQLPLINQAVVGLAPKDYAAGISLNNMIRQLGGAFGIAMMNTFVNQRYAIHRVDLLANTNTNDPEMMQRLYGATQLFVSKGMSAINATQAAYNSIDVAVTRQAYMQSYLDAFLLISLFFIATIPFMFFLRTNKVDNKTMAKIAEESH
jgi:DHA2 family multidrug resistance protein